MDTYLIQETPQRWQYIEKLQNGVIIARVETTVQRGHILITVEEHPVFAKETPFRGTVRTTDISAEEISRLIAAMTSESYRNGKRTKTQNNSIT